MVNLRVHRIITIRMPEGFYRISYLDFVHVLIQHYLDIGQFMKTESAWNYLETVLDEPQEIMVLARGHAALPWSKVKPSCVFHDEPLSDDRLWTAAHFQIITLEVDNAVL